MLSKKSEEVLNRAGTLAIRRMHEYVTIEHVLMALLEETQLWDMLVTLGSNYEGIKKELEHYLDHDIPKARKLKDDTVEMEDEDLVEPPAATLGLQRLVQRSIFHVQSAGKQEVVPQDFFVAIFQAKDSIALHILEKHGIERLKVLEYLSHGNGNNEITEANSDDESGSSEKKQKKESNDPLSQYTVALHELAKAGKLDPLVGRANELERVIQTLCRRRKNNPILVGEAGVGKTAIVEGLANKIVNKDLPEVLFGTEVYSLDIGALLAGAKFRGDFEQRLKRVIKSLQTKKEKGINVVLFIDEIHTIIGAGSVSGGTLDAANLLKPMLSRGEIQCIGSTTYNEYRNIFEKDHALSRRFQKIDVTEPTKEDTLKILEGLKSKFESHHSVTYSADAIDACVTLSIQHLHDRFLPDKAIDVMDEVGAKAHLSSKKEITALEVEEIIAQIARIPSRSVSHDQKHRLKTLERDLKHTIFGQDHAISQITNAILLARSGLRTGEKPVGSFLFCGPTGVGKTELSKQLAFTMGIPFIRFDMSEYMEKHTVSRLIGAPPGYVGFEQAGLLTDAVRKQPHAVILLDEIEKAHPDVWNILLQVMDHGTLTDNNGKKADFRNVVLILTTNVGSREHDRRQLGLGDATPSSDASKSEIERAFSPEFRNRLDAIVYFNLLDPITIAQIVGKNIIELETQLLAKHVELEVTAEAREWFARKGYDKKLGARPMARLMQDRVKKPLAEEILFGKLEHGGKVFVVYDSVKDEIKIEVLPKTAEGYGTARFLISPETRHD